VRVREPGDDPYPHPDPCGSEGEGKRASRVRATWRTRAGPGVRESLSCCRCPVHRIGAVVVWAVMPLT
jgi:hypothetical protein